jgi:cytochrome c-type biogenesis protein CcmE
MTPARKRRLYWVLGILAGVGIAGALALSAFQKNVMFFFDPSQVAAGEVKEGQRFRLGGMVAQNSFRREAGSLEVSFVVTDFRHQLPVRYTGVLPDLFREGQGVVAHGRLGADGVFIADEVLAKHDEKYMPPEVARSLKKNGADATYVPEGESGSSGPAPMERPEGI